MFIHPEPSIRWFYFEKSQENSCGGFSFLIKLQTPLHLFSCEFCEIKNIFFVEKLRTAAFKHRIYIFFFVLILRQNRYLPLNSDHLLGKQRTMLRYRSHPSKISYLRFGDVFYFFPVLSKQFDFCVGLTNCWIKYTATEKVNDKVCDTRTKSLYYTHKKYYLI